MRVAFLLNKNLLDRQRAEVKSQIKAWRKGEAMKQGGSIRNTMLLFSLFLFLAGTGSIPSPAMAQSCPSPNTNSLIAHYRFDGNEYDSTGYNSPMELKNPLWVDNHLSLNGKYDLDCPTTGYRAIGTLPCLNFDAFTLSLDFYPTNWGTLMPGEGGGSSTCGFTSNILTGGEFTRWFRLRRDDATGNLMLTLNNGPRGSKLFRTCFYWHLLVPR